MSSYKKEILYHLSQVGEIYGNTNQIYGILLALLNNKLDPTTVKDFLQIVLQKYKTMDINGNTYSFFLEGEPFSNYYISHTYNFSLNLLCYIVLKKYNSENLYGDVLAKLEEFLTFEIKFIDINEKPIGAELVIGKFSAKVNNLKNKSKVLIAWKELRKSRLKNFSKILFFTPEGLSWRKLLKLSLIIKLKQKLLWDDEIFLFNSPDLTCFFLDSLPKKDMHSVINFVKKNKGTPPFYKGAFYDLFWSYEILKTSELVDKDINDLFFRKINELSAFSETILGCFNIMKGWSINPKFNLYDLDTTSMGIKCLEDFLNDKYKFIKDFNFKYYYDYTSKRYSTYKNDNRESISVLSHVLSAQCSLDKVDSQLVEKVKSLVGKEELFDKFHTSKLYIYYTVLVAFTDLTLKGYNMRSEVDKVIKIVLQYQLPNGSFTSIAGLIDGTVEETCWAILAIRYAYSKLKINRSEVKKAFIRGQDFVAKNKKGSDKLENLWIVKQPYTPNIINTILINSSICTKI